LGLKEQYGDANGSLWDCREGFQLSIDEGEITLSLGGYARTLRFVHELQNAFALTGQELQATTPENK